MWHSYMAQLLLLNAPSANNQCSMELTTVIPTAHDVSTHTHVYHTLT